MTVTEGSGDQEKSHLDGNLSTNVDLSGDPDDSKAQLIINANGGAGVDHVGVKIVDGTTASSDGDVSFNGLGKDEVMKYADEPFWKRLRLILFILFWLAWIAMLVTAIIIIALAPRCPPKPDLKWYQTDVVYQVVPESFKDSSGDGYGDFNGMDEKLGHVTDDLGMNATWIGNVYKTDPLSTDNIDANKRGIIDHKAIRDSFGATPEKLKSWIKNLRKEGKKIILDLVPNQSSKKHTWFQKSRAGDEKYKDYYIWHSGGGSNNGSVPNDWTNHKGATAWTYDSERKAYYFHQFDEDLPDLNLANEAVVDEIKDIMTFWFDMGVSGFHIQDVEYLVENPDLTASKDTATRNYMGTYAFLDKLRGVVDGYQKPGQERFIFATVKDANKNQTLTYYGTDGKKRLDIVISVMNEFKQDCNAACVYKMVQSRLTDQENQWLGLSLSDPTTMRVASRLGDSKVALHAAHALELLLPGTAFNYYGDEYGQSQGATGSSQSPMQWNTQPNAGFTGGNVTLEGWQKLATDWENNNLKAGLAHFSGKTPLKGFQELVKLRQMPSMQWGETKMCTQGDHLFMFTRKAYRFNYFLVMMNLGTDQQLVALNRVSCVDSEEEGTIVFHSREDEVGTVLNVHDAPIRLEGGDVLVLDFPTTDES